MTSEATNLQPDDVWINIGEEITVAADSNAVVDLVAEKLVAGEISLTLRGEVKDMVDQLDTSNPAARVGVAIYLIATSPEYAYQR